MLLFGELCSDDGVCVRERAHSYTHIWLSFATWNSFNLTQHFEIFISVFAPVGNTIDSTQNFISILYVLALRWLFISASFPLLSSLFFILCIFLARLSPLEIETLKQFYFQSSGKSMNFDWMFETSRCLAPTVAMVLPFFVVRNFFLDWFNSLEFKLTIIVAKRCRRWSAFLIDLFMTRVAICFNNCTWFCFDFSY